MVCRIDFLGNHKESGEIFFNARIRRIQFMEKTGTKLSKKCVKNQTLLDFLKVQKVFLSITMDTMDSPFEDNRGGRAGRNPRPELFRSYFRCKIFRQKNHG
jgi:hypothetical protein